MASAGFIGRIETTTCRGTGPPGSSRSRCDSRVAFKVMWRSWMTAVDQRFLEGVRAAQHEGDEVVAPYAPDVGGLVHHLAAAEDAVARQIGADVEVLAERRQLDIAGAEDASNGQGFGLSGQKTQKICGQRRRQDDEVALHIAGRDAGVWPASGARAAGERRRARSAGPAEGSRDIAATTVIGILQYVRAGASLANEDARDAAQSGARGAILIIMPAWENRSSMDAGSRLLRD